MKTKLKLIVLMTLSIFISSALFGQDAIERERTFDCEYYLQKASDEKVVTETEDESSNELHLISIFPNPSEGFVFVRITSSKTETVQVNILDALGRLETNLKLPLKSGLNVKKINTSDLSHGVFYINMLAESPEPIYMNFFKL